MAHRQGHQYVQCDCLRRSQEGQGESDGGGAEEEVQRRRGGDERGEEQTGVVAQV